MRRVACAYPPYCSHISHVDRMGRLGLSGAVHAYATVSRYHACDVCAEDNKQDETCNVERVIQASIVYVCSRPFGVEAVGDGWWVEEDCVCAGDVGRRKVSGSSGVGVAHRVSNVSNMSWIPSDALQRCGHRASLRCESAGALLGFALRFRLKPVQTETVARRVRICTVRSCPYL